MIDDPWMDGYMAAYARHSIALFRWAFTPSLEASLFKAGFFSALRELML